MANKLQQIRDLSLETSKEITSTPEKWLEFLDTLQRVLILILGIQNFIVGFKKVLKELL